MAREASPELRDAGADLFAGLRRYDDGATADLDRYAREVMPAL